MKPSVPRRSRPRPVLDTVSPICAWPVLLLAAVVVACAGAPSAKTAQEQERSAQDRDEVQPQGGQQDGDEDPGRGRSSHIEYPTPPDGEWLVDDQGREYFLVEVPKVEGTYKRLSEDRIRDPRGVPYYVAVETDEAFFVKIFRVEPIRPQPKTGPSAEELEAIAASYEAEIPTEETLVLRSFDEGLPGTGQWRNGFGVGDVNGDSHADLVLTSPRKSPGPPVVLLGDGAGSWQRWKEASFPAAPYDYGDAKVADLDRDGQLDLALAVHLSGLLALKAEGSGGFSRWSEGLKIVRPEHADNRTFLSRAIALTDWDGDGWTDLVALSEGPRHPKATQRGEVEAPQGLAVFLNQGDGRWSPGPRAGEGGLFGDSLAIGDFDGDGRPDIATSTSLQSHKHLVHLNRGAAGISSVAPRPLRKRAFVWAVAAADFDGDGQDDLVLSLTGNEPGGPFGALEILRTQQSSDEALESERLVLDGFSDDAAERITALATGDLNGDGAPDVAAGTGDGRLRLFLGRGDGSFFEESSPELPEGREGCRAYEVRLADLDGRPEDEVVMAVAGDRCPGGGSVRAWTVTDD